MGKSSKQSKKPGKAGEEVGDSQQRLSTSAGVLHVKRKAKEVNVNLAEKFDEGGDVSGGEAICPLGELPRKIFAINEIPREGRINTYSRIERLSEIVEVLDGTPELDWILDSPFGTLFGLSTRYCEFSGRLVHGLLCRSLVVNKKHERWFVFGGKPLRFSLTEFAKITGLNCNPLPSKDEIKRMQTPEEDDEPYWNYLIGKPKTMSIEGILRLLKADKKAPPHERMDPEKRLRLCLVVIVEGVLCIRSSAVAATKGTVEMVKDLDSFCNYPWGRESFDLTLRMVNVDDKVGSLDNLHGKLFHSHISNHGFTLAYQLLALYTIPLLERIVPVKDFDSYFYDPLFTGLAKAKPFHNDNILTAEKSPSLIVESLLSTGHSIAEWDLTWRDEVDDPKVDRILRGLEGGYFFNPSDWKLEKIRQIRRQPKAKPKTILVGDTVKFSADSLVIEGDKLMDDYLARKHDFEIREFEALKEGYRDLIIRALTINDQSGPSRKDDLFGEDDKAFCTPREEGVVASEAQGMSSDDQDSGEQLTRKNKGKGKKGKAKGKRVQAEIAEEGDDRDRQQKKKKIGKDFDSPSNVKDPDPVAKSLDDIVHEVAEMIVQPPETVDLTEDDNKELEGKNEANRETDEVGGDTVMSPRPDEQHTAPTGGVVITATQVDASAGLVETRESQMFSQPSAAVDRTVDDGNPPDATNESSHGTGEVDEQTLATPMPNEPHTAPTVASGGDVPMTHIEPAVPEMQTPGPTSASVPVIDRESVEPTIDGATDSQAVQLPTADPHIPNSTKDSDHPDVDGVAPPTKFAEDLLVGDDDDGRAGQDVESVSEAVDSHAGGIDSQAPASEDLGIDASDKNDGSGNEGEDVEERQSVGGIQGPVIALRSTRPRHAPRRYGQTPEEKQKSLEIVEEEYDPMRPLADVKKDMFYKALDNRKIKEFKVLGDEVKKTFFREIYKPKQHVGTAHMEAMLSNVWARRGENMLSNKVAVMDSWFCQYLIQEHGRYSKSKNPPVPFKWHTAIKNYVAGDMDNRDGSLRWMVDVDNLYAPMNWGTNHWVALNINLITGTVNILDCNQNLTPDSKVPRLMKPVVEVLPLILRDLVDPALEAADSFDFIRGIGVTQNERSGDCGPLTVKFIELDGQGYSVEGISEEQVDELRMRYAFEVYEGNGNPL